MSRSKLSFILLTLFLSSLLVLGAAASLDQAVSELSSKLMCLCGCTMVVSDCTCGNAVGIKDSIRAKIAAGTDGKGILDYFVATYGEKILAEPKKEGFNLAAWIVPFAAALLGLALIGILLSSWVKAGQNEAAVPLQEAAATTDSNYLLRLEDELRRYD